MLAGTTMSEEEKRETEETTEEAEDEREAETQQTLALALQELETIDDLRGKWPLLEGIVEDHGLDVKTNKGGHNSRTLEQFKNDIIAALERRLNVAPRPASPVDVAQLTTQLGQTNIQGGGTADSNSDSGSDDESETESQVEERERERERQRQRQREINQGPDYYDTFDGRYYGGHESDCEEDRPGNSW